MSQMTTIQTDKAPAAIGPYSQAVRMGNLLFCSGQIPLDPATGEFVSGGIREQTEQVMKNLSAVLTAAGVTFKEVAKTTIFLKNMSDFAIVNEVYGTFLNAPYPARATIEVAALPKGALVEIDAIAQISE